MILLNPGPVGLSERVRRALLAPDLCHRESEFAELQDAVRARLLGVYGLDAGSWAPIVLSGSGSSALEAMLTSLIPTDGGVLVVENGPYGERMSEIARRHAIRARSVRFEWGEPIEAARVRKALADGERLTHLAVVHHETATGRLNDLEPLGELCREAGLGLLVDAVSSFGAEAIEFEAWSIAACAATAGKCLHGAPGASFVIARHRALASGCRPPRTLSLDLVDHCREQSRGSTSFTPAVPALYALREALEELADAGGWAERGRRYGALAERVRRGLAAHGIEPYLDAEASSVVLRSYRLPRGMPYATLHDELKKRGFVIYAGQQRLEGRIFRISTMGEISDRDVERLLAAFAEIGHPARREPGP
jgi:2-aminoethylphosphonate-pyruvate transaminase